jgi:hypothetical protein
MDRSSARCATLAAVSRGTRRALRLVGVAAAYGGSAILAHGAEQGTYVGSATLSGTRVGPEETYNATVQFELPVTDRDDNTATAEFFGGEAPNARVTIAQWDMSLCACRAGGDCHDADRRSQH